MLLGMFGLVQRLKSSRTSLRVSVSEAVAEAAAARAAAENSAASAAHALQLLRDLEQQSMEASPRRFRVLLGTVVLLILLLVLCTWLIPSGFSSPPPQVMEPGLVQVALELGDSPTPSEDEALRQVVVSTTYDEADGEVSYVVDFPQDLAGRTFKVLLAGSAVMKDYPPIIDEWFTVDSGPCGDPEIIPNYYLQDLKCQVLTGVVKGSGSPLPLQNCRDQEFTDPDTGYYEETIYGTAPLPVRTDWAHRTVQLPDVGGMSLWGDPNEGGHPLGIDSAVSAVTFPTTCQTLELARDRDEHASSVDPTQQSVSQFDWGPWQGSFGGIAVISARRDTGALGNLLLAGVGVLAALLIGLLPVTYESWRRRRRFLQSVNAAART